MTVEKPTLRSKGTAQNQLAYFCSRFGVFR